MKTFLVIVSIIILIVIVWGGLYNTKRRGKQKDKAVAEAAEVETTKPTVINASGIKPVNIDKALAELKDKTAAMASTNAASNIQY